MTSRRRSLGVASAVLALAALTGCDGSDAGDSGKGSSFAGTAPDAMVETAMSAMEDLSAVHLTGTLTNQGQAADVDLALSDDGSCDGTFTIDDGVAEIRAVDGKAWFRPDADIWKTFAGENATQVMDFVGNKWVVLEQAQFLEMCDFRSIMDSLISSPEDGRKYSEDGSEEINGEETIRIKSEGTAGTTFGYVQAEEPHYLVRTERSGGEAPATVTFSDFDEAADVEAPAADEIIDLADFTS